MDGEGCCGFWGLGREGKGCESISDAAYRLLVGIFGVSPVCRRIQRITTAYCGITLTLALFLDLDLAQVLTLTLLTLL